MTRTNRNLKKNNTKRRSNRNKTRTINKKFIKGGMLIKGNYSPKGALLYFLMNSTFEYSGIGASSITLKCNFNKDPKKSPYYGLSAFATLGQPITCILLKLSFWANHDTKRQENKKKHKIGTYERQFSHLMTFEIEKEANIQHIIYENTLLENKAFNPICPAMLFCQSSPLSKNDNNFLINHILSNLTNTNDTNYVKIFLGEDVIFTAMEFFPNSKSIRWLISNSNDEKSNSNDENLKKQIAAIELHSLSRLHKLGFKHNDLHFENLLFVPDYKFYKKGINGSIYIIDFGLANKIKETEEADQIDIIKNKPRSESLKIENALRKGSVIDLIYKEFGIRMTDNDLEEELEKIDKTQLDRASEIKKIISENDEYYYNMFGYDITKSLNEDTNETFISNFFTNAKGRLKPKNIIGVCANFKEDEIVHRMQEK